MILLLTFTMRLQSRFLPYPKFIPTAAERFGVRIFRRKLHLVFIMRSIIFSSFLENCHGKNTADQFLGGKHDEHNYNSRHHLDNRNVQAKNFV